LLSRMGTPSHARPSATLSPLPVNGKKRWEFSPAWRNLHSTYNVSPFDIALIHTALGDKEKAFEWLQRAYEERSAFLVYMKWEPRLDPLRSDPRFQHLQRQVGLPG
jgi:hypothetical protein